MAKKEVKIDKETWDLTLSCVYCDETWTTRRHLRGLQLKCPECQKVNEVDGAEWLPQIRGDK